MFLSDLGKEEYEIYFHIVIIVLLLYLVFKCRLRHRYVNPKFAAQVAARRAAMRGAPPAQQAVAANEAEANQTVSNAVAASQSS